ncbi:MAG TPA: ABC transporter permease [Candidatus Dojkabacteria bacterium]|jgi:ABC-2 type transport system permease protein|nr:ABC transporter permease [Candidatus Dojkabacteria bacterium]
MFFNVFKNTLKILLRDKATVFWTVIFSILLAIMFKMAFSNLDKIDKFEAIPIAVQEQALEDEFFSKYITTLEEEEYIEVVKLEGKTEDERKEEAGKLLEEKTIVAFIENEESIVLGKGSNRIEETVIKSLMEGYIQNKSMVMNILKENPHTNIADILNFETYVKDVSNKNMTVINTFFYTLIGMQALYSYIWGMRVMYMYEANLSTQGKRNSISPTNKRISILASMFSAWALSILSSLIGIGFIIFILDINIGSKVIPILSLLLLGTLTGVSFGSFIAVSNRQSVGVKNGIGIGITMFWSFLAGMMASSIKILIERNIPILNKLNPVALITDALYSLYYYNTYDRFFGNIIYLSLVTLIFVLGTIFFMRGKKYESL